MFPTYTYILHERQGVPVHVVKTGLAENKNSKTRNKEAPTAHSSDPPKNICSMQPEGLGPYQHLSFCQKPLLGRAILSPLMLGPLTPGALFSSW